MSPKVEGHKETRVRDVTPIGTPVQLTHHLQYESSLRVNVSLFPTTYLTSKKREVTQDVPESLPVVILTWGKRVLSLNKK